MDLFEEVIRLRREGKRGVLATIIHTNGSIPSYESSRMLVREDGSIAGTIGGGCVEAEVWAAAKEVMSEEAPRKMTFSLNNEANYDNGLISGGSGLCHDASSWPVGSVNWITAPRGAFEVAQIRPL